MNIAVYCSSSNHIAACYKQMAFELGKYLAQNDHTLIYGGATGGLMDAVAEGANSENGKIIGVIADAIIRMNRQSILPSELIIVRNMSQRKERMKELADAFVVLPGSFGTLDELFDVVASGVVGEHKKPCIILNYNNFFEGLQTQILRMHAESFMPVIELYKPVVVDNLAQCVDILEAIVSSTEANKHVIG